MAVEFSFGANRRGEGAPRGWAAVLARLDLSAILLILSNLFTIVLALVERWDLRPLLWIYWFQSVTIGVFNVVKIANLRNFTTENFTINDRPVPPTDETRRKVAAFFAFHYGFFHLAYLVFIVIITVLPEEPMRWDPWIVVTAAVFFLNHLASFNLNRTADSERPQNIGSVMAFPYLRIVPMHLTIIFGFVVSKGVVLFLVLKSIADLIAHQIEHGRRATPLAGGSRRGYK